jgi:malonate-semialdehyde dehydrogenase (acetylating)/methylmalonate-semialdehyde dehydrogenase
VGDIHDKFVEHFLDAARRLRIGYGLESGTDMGPLISRTHRERVVGWIGKGEAEGAKLMLDGRGAKVEHYPQGNFLGPTTFDAVEPEMAIAREEIFGPVASILRARGLEEAIGIINGSPYGNAASIYTANGLAAREFRYRVRCGNIGINVGVAAPMAYFPFGGQKASFFGTLHAQGREAIDFFTDRKVVITRWF